MAVMSVKNWVVIRFTSGALEYHILSLSKIFDVLKDNQKSLRGFHIDKKVGQMAEESSIEVKRTVIYSTNCTLSDRHHGQTSP